MNFAIKKYILKTLMAALLLPAVGLFAGIDPTVVEKIKTSVVTVDTDTLKSAHDRMGFFGGTAFLVNKELGIFATNAHVAHRDSYGHVKLSLADGTEIPASVLHTDPQHDFAFLKVDPKALPAEIEAIPLNTKENKLHGKYWIWDNNGGEGFCVTTINLIDQHKIIRELPQQDMTFNISVRPGTSGSPVMTPNGEAIGIMHASADNSSYALPSAYLVEALSALENGITPPRKDIGVIWTYTALSRLEKYAGLPKSVAEDPIYAKSKKKGLIVESTLVGSGARGLLKPGDLIWSVNGERVGSELLELQSLMNRAEGDTINVEIYRAGALKALTLKLQDLNQTFVKKMLVLGSSVFFEADGYVQRMFGLPLGTLCMGKAYFSPIFKVTSYDELSIPEKPELIQVTQFGDYEVNTLEQLQACIPELISKKHFFFHYINLAPSPTAFGRFIQNQGEQASAVDYDPMCCDRPYVLEYDEGTYAWKRTDL